MKLKVCGITMPDQFSWLEGKDVDMIGINFYPPSKRYVDKPFYKSLNKSKTKKVGVFVNAEAQFIDNKIKDFHLDMVQLHGGESVEYCTELSKEIPIIKVFGIDNDFNFDDVVPFLESSTYLLFDTKTPDYGGSGNKFEWQMLNDYKHKKPFLLSGGIRLSDLDNIKKIKHPKLFGIDVNSGFEKGAGNKDLLQLEQLIKTI